jgi:hypothetical protein
MKIIKGIGKFVVSAGIGIANTLMGGLVLSKSWGWFIVAKFESLPALSLLDAVGFQFVVSVLFTNMYMAIIERKPKDPDHDKWLNGTIRSAMLLCMGWPAILLFAWGWHSFMVSP